MHRAFLFLFFRDIAMLSQDKDKSMPRVSGIIRLAVMVRKQRFGRSISLDPLTPGTLESMESGRR
jgi:hypothetical protein